MSIIASSGVYSSSSSRRLLRRLDLFGGDTKAWKEADWVAQDDRLRGGSSVSHLTIAVAAGGVAGAVATFHGTLDSTTLGGAGFASQRTSAEGDHNSLWDLSSYDGLELLVVVGDIPPKEGGGLTPAAAPRMDRVYTLLLKDRITPGEPDSGREISWQWNFTPRTPGASPSPSPSGEEGPFSTTGADTDRYRDRDRVPSPSTTQRFTAYWSDFKPFYRGRPVDEHDSRLNTKTIRRFSIMIRSFFQGQADGDFSVSLASISAIGGEGGGGDGDGAVVVTENSRGE